MGLLNCWNWKNCGRYPGGPKADELGVCKATIDNDSDGYLNGRGAGRSCLYLTGTLCGGKVQGSYAAKQANCLKCDYYLALKKEYGSGLSSFKYKEHIALPKSQKSKTPANQKWIAKNIPATETAKNAKNNYK